MEAVRGQLHEMWKFLIEPRNQFDAFPRDDPEGDALRARHRSTLDVLVAAGELTAAVAERFQVAFDEAVTHISLSQSMCYLIYPMEAFPRGDLLGRAQALGDIETGIDTETVAQARAAIERDMAFFHGKLEDKQLIALWQSGEIPIDPETRAAARFLVDLMSEEQS
jgi:uncharacterized membrane protein YccC